MTSVHPTTVVVPLYGDLPSALACIVSVLAHVDLGVHRLLVVNDCGPDVDAIERAVLETIHGREGVRYVRNAKNLGFVGTCNRAAQELDETDNDILLLNSDAELREGTLEEMSAVLHLHEKHGVVTARSNNATIATIPLRTRTGTPASARRSEEVFAALATSLPRFTIAPVAHGFCFLVRRSLIRNHGLFDTVFAPGYGEENDFCLRINDLGYSSIIANHAYAHHEGEKSFSSLAQRQIQRDHEKLLVERYPHYPAAVVHYLRDSVDAVDWFADLLVPGGERPRALIDLHHMSLIYDGSVRNALTFLRLLQSRSDQHGVVEGVEFSIAASPESLEFFDLARFGFPVLNFDEIDEVFDIGFSLAPITAPQQIQHLDRLCLRWVASHLDIIALRAMPLLESDYSRREVVRDALRFADRVVTISQSTLDDTLAYFPELQTILPDRTSVVPQGVADGSLEPGSALFDPDEQLSPRQRNTVRQGGYVLVIGNTFLHKQLRGAERALSGFRLPVVLFGGRDQPYDNIVPLPGGYLSDADMSAMYENAAVIVYPSAYEGFGLPIAEAALHAKPVVLFSTGVAREVVDVLRLHDQARFFDDFSALQKTVDEALAPSPVPQTTVRTIDDYNSAVIDVILRTLTEPVSFEKLRDRRRHLRATRAYAHGPLAAMEYLGWQLSRRSFRLVDAVVRRAEFLRPAARRLLHRARPSAGDEKL